MVVYSVIVYILRLLLISGSYQLSSLVLLAASSVINVIIYFMFIVSYNNTVTLNAIKGHNLYINSLKHFNFFGTSIEGDIGSHMEFQANPAVSFQNIVEVVILSLKKQCIS